MKPLSNTKRTFLLTIFVLVFIILAPTLLLYSTGYRLDLKDTFSLVKTGGIFIQSDFSNTRVYLDGEFIENNGLILRNTFVQDLWPNREYKIVVQKDNYHSWQKYIKVYPNIVTETSVFILPTSFNITEVTQYQSADFENSSATSSIDSRGNVELSLNENPEYLEVLDLFSKDLDQFESEVSTTTLDSRGILRRATTTILELPDFILNLEQSDISNMQDSNSSNSSDIATSSENALVSKLKSQGVDQIIENNRLLSWNEDGALHFVWVDDKESIPYYFCNLDDCRDEILLSFSNKITRHQFFPGRNDVVIVSNSDGIFAVEIDDRSERNIFPIYVESNVDFRLVGNTLYVLDQGRIFKLEL